MVAIRKFLIAGGNPTALVWDCSGADRLRYAQELLHDVEQVGFVDELGGTPTLTMMGNELCIDAMLALAYVLGGEGTLAASGHNKPVTYRAKDGETSINVYLPYRRDGLRVIFEGIGYEYSDTPATATKVALAELTRHYSVPAFGLLTMDDGVLQPQVYVRATDSLVHETACGSGSIAMHILLGTEQVTQPSGQQIEVRGDTNFSIRASVMELN